MSCMQFDTTTSTYRYADMRRAATFKYYFGSLEMKCNVNIQFASQTFLEGNGMRLHVLVYFCNMTTLMITVIMPLEVQHFNF